MLSVVPTPAGEGGDVGSELLLDVGGEAVLQSDVPGMIGDVGNGDFAILILLDGVAVDAHVGVIEIGEQADGAGALGDQAVVFFELEIFGVDVPGLPDQIDAVGDLWHERFDEAEGPVGVVVFDQATDGVAAGVGGVVPGAVVVDGPVEELEVSVGADGVGVEEVGEAEFAEADFDAAAGKSVEEGELVAVVFDSV